ncbi:MAG: SMC family ATPase [Candidatus Aenigmarchaeota archaeon]|nr:SMC family ATPase [Candidatus Aenigmarchaeota archaeon]
MVDNMITGLKLQNWRSHLNSELDFADGTNCFIGNMGTGKSSIMSAICFALFGTFPDLQSKKIKLEDIIMKKPSKKENAFVSLDFSINDDKWTVKRTVEKGRTTAELFKNDKLVESPQPSKVTAEIERLLKIDYDLFTRAIYSEQNQLDIFLTIPKGQRMKKIDELLSIDKFEKARATSKTLIGKCSDAVSQKRQMISNLEADGSLKRLDQLKIEVRRMTEEVEHMKKQLDATRIRKASMEKAIVNLKEQDAKVKSVQEQIKINMQLYEITDKDIEKIKEDLMEHAEDTTEQLKAELEKIIAQTAELEYSFSKEKENLSVLRETNAQNEAKISILKKEKIPILSKFAEEKKIIVKKITTYENNNVEAELKGSKEEFEKLNSELQKNIAKIEELEESLKDLDNVDSHCPICESALPSSKKSSLKTKKKNQIDKMKDSIKELKSTLKKTENSIGKLEVSVKELAEFKQRLKYVNDSDKDLAFAEEELSKLEKSLDSYLKQRKMQEKTVEVLEKAVSKARTDQNNIKELIFKRNEVEVKLEKLKNIKFTLSKLNEEKLTMMGYSSSNLEIAEREIMSLIGLEREIETKIKSFDVLFNERGKTINELETKNKLLDSLKTDISKVEAISEQLKLLEVGLITTQEELRKNFVASVNTAMQAVWTDIYPYNDFFGVRLGIEGGDYVLQLQDSTGWIPVDGVVSGGERSIACLVLRIAFSLVLAPQLRWIVLDEPTHNLDAHAVDELSNVLREKVTNIVEQIFLITHDPALENAVSGYLYKLDREKKKDGYTSITKISAN